MYRSIEELNGDCDPDDVVHLAEVYAFIIEDRDGGLLINSRRAHDGAVFVPGKVIHTVGEPYDPSDRSYIEIEDHWIVENGIQAWVPDWQHCE